MKIVSIPILEGHSSVVVFPHKRQDEKVRLYIIIFYYSIYFQDLSFVYVVFNGTELPKETGNFISLEFKDSYDYCLVPSCRTDQGRLMSYPCRPAFIDLFSYSYQISKVE